MRLWPGPRMTVTLAPFKRSKPRSKRPSGNDTTGDTYSNTG